MRINRNRDLAAELPLHVNGHAEGILTNGTSLGRITGRRNALMDSTPRIEQYDEDLRPDVLISRFIDGAADDDDRRHFESLAERDPHLWRELALRQSDAAALSAGVEPMLDRMERVCAPAESGPAMRRRMLTMPVALSGWAAMLIIGVTWAIVAMVHTNGQPTGGSRVDDAPVFQPYSHMEHLERYGQAPWVLGEMQPQALEIQTLSDGSVDVRFLRRIEETITFANDKELDAAIDVNTGRFKIPVKQLREDPERGLDAGDEQDTGPQ